MNRRLLTFMITLFCSIAIFAQQSKSLSGTVCDDNSGEPLIGATIQEPGTGNGTVTDLDGHFSLSIKGSQLTVSYVGYASQKITVKTSGTYNIRMKSNTDLNEIVVIGYGTQRKSDLTGSVVSVTDKDFKNYSVSNMSELLQGKAAGVYVASGSGQPGDDAIVRVRGLGTVNDNNPLYVVDGQFMNNISSINPSDIERIEVLKDASACAIYGSRGSNGVILVTTKHGKSGETQITLDVSVGSKTAYKALDMMNSDQYYQFITTAYKNDANFQNSQLNKFTSQYKKGYNTDWWDAATHSGFQQNYNLSIRNGSDKSRTAFSMSYDNDQGSIITTEFKRLTARLNQEYDLNKYITVGVNMNISKMKKKDAENLSSFDYILKADPFTPVINPLVDPSSDNYQYNKYAPTEWSYNPNPVQLLEDCDRYNEITNMTGNVYAQINLCKGLSYRAQFSYEYNDDSFSDFIPIYTSTYDEYNLANTESKYNSETKLTNNDTKVSNYTIEQRLNYNKKIGKNNFDAMIAMTYEKDNTSYIDAYKANGLGNDENYRVLNAQTTGDNVSGNKTITSMLSYLGRVNYSYNDKYLATVNFRADGSSRFAKENRWGYFPSFSLGWRVNNEDFFKNSILNKFVDNLKFRIGWGQNGNQRIDSSAPLTLIGTSSENKWYFGNGYSQGYVPTYQGNADIKWETSQQTNIGLDATLLRNSLELTMDFYVKKTKDMLLNEPIPEFGSYPNDPYFNAGDLKNTGFDFTGNYRNHIGSLNYNVGISLSTYKTKVTKLTSDYLSGTVSRTYVGGPIGRFYGYKVIGIFQNKEEIENYKTDDGTVIQPNAQPGDFKFAKTTSSGALNDNDRTFIGDPNPDLIYGFNIGFAYKGFDLTAAFGGTLGNDIYNQAKGSLAQAGMQNALADALTKAWTKDGDTNATFPRITNSNNNDNFRTSSFYVENGSYLRLLNLQLGYTLPSKLFSKISYFKGCHFYVSGQNLFTITGYSGLDPDLGIDSALNMGVDTTRYPTSRVITFGVNLQF